MIRPRLVLCSGAPAPRDSAIYDRHVVTLDTIDPRGNTCLRLENVTDAFAQLLKPRVIDLLELAAYIFTADCEAGREGVWLHERTMEQWGRDFQFIAGVRDAEFWTRDDVTRSLTSVIEYMSGDRVSFEFCKLSKERPIQPYLDLTKADDSPFYSIDRVTMFSGGLDSLSGAAQAAANGEKLVLVSHRPVSSANARQRNLAQKLQQRFDVPVRHVPVWVNKKRFDAESSQRTRVFLFAALGTAVASVLGARGIRFYENGVISLNWPLADEILGSRSSRTTHPETMKRLEGFLQLVLEDNAFIIDNPYLYKTKAEVVASLQQAGAPDLIADSCSCVHTMFQQKAKPHCGCCGQCIDRRVAVLACGLERHDPGDRYVQDVFTGARVLKAGNPYNHNIAVHYTRFARDMHRLEEYEIATRYNTEISRAVRPFHDIGSAIERFIDMQKRHGQTVCDTISNQIQARCKDIAAGRIDKSSLLVMAAGSKLDYLLDTQAMDQEVTESFEHISSASSHQIAHSPDFRSLTIDGTTHLFTAMQARVMECLWKARDAGIWDVSLTELLQVANTQQVRLQDVFRDHKTWKQVIESRAKGMYRLRN